MTINFCKYHGAANDFILIDNRQMLFNADREHIATICNRRTGIGADGLILLNESPGYDFEMVYFNSDGSRSSFCGNGARCITAFAHDLGIVMKEARFIGADGEHQSRILSANENQTLVSVKMSNIEEVEIENNDYILDTGSPHFVRFVKKLDQYNVAKEGQEIRNLNRFLIEGINVNFAEKKQDVVYMRTYERGVEAETMSCGTGAVAVAAVMALKSRKNLSMLEVQTPGGKLHVRFAKVEDGFIDIWLEGPAEAVFKGEFEF